MYKNHELREYELEKVKLIIYNLTIMNFNKLSLV